VLVILGADWIDITILATLASGIASPPAAEGRRFSQRRPASGLLSVASGTPRVDNDPVPDQYISEPAPSLGASYGGVLSMVWVLVVGSCVTLPLIFSIWSFFVYRRRSIRAESLEKKQPLMEGPALLRGHVETEGASPAVRIESLHNALGEEQGNRVVHVRPFRLRVPGGDIVQVIPHERIRLVNARTTDISEGNYKRRFVEIENGEEVWVSGVLSREEEKTGASTAYRSGPGSWVLRGTRMEPLEVASGSLGQYFSKQQRLWRNRINVLGVMFTIVHVGLFGPYYALLWLGEVETVPVTDTSTKWENDTEFSTAYMVHAKLSEKAGRAAVWDRVEEDVYRLAREGKLKEVPFIYVPSATWIHAIGKHAPVGPWSGILSVLLGLYIALEFHSLLKEQRSVEVLYHFDQLHRGSTTRSRM
jgi:hypothetical protein